MRTLPVVTSRRRGDCCEVGLPIAPGRAVEVAGLLRVLADPTRLSMLAALRASEAPVCICDFTAAYGLSQPTISHHVSKLREAGLVESRRDGVWIHYSLSRPLPRAVERLLDAIDEDASSGAALSRTRA